MTTWDKSLETGDDVIDWQHREMFAIVDDLRAAGVEESAGDHIDLLLDRMMLYAANHFEAEEQLMASRGYNLTEARAHQADHIRLRQQVTELVAQRRSGALQTIMPIAVCLEDWLCVHIKKVDRKFVDFVRA